MKKASPTLLSRDTIHLSRVVNELHCRQRVTKFPLYPFGETRMDELKPTEPGTRKTIYEIIFEADTGPGKAFDVALLVFIVVSVLAVVFESVSAIEQKYGRLFFYVEWLITIFFTVEYILRVYCCEKPKKYIFSFFGIVDLLALLPTYLSLMVAGTHFLIVIRTVRLLRAFKILQMTRYVGESHVLMDALKASQPKITVFLGTVVSLVVIIGALMFMIEGPENGFHSIPRGMYWAIVTLTTVGYGDIAPQTLSGQLLAAFVMVIGYGIIAVPTGIVTSELTKSRIEGAGRSCGCGYSESDRAAKYCKRCGDSLSPV